MALILFQSERLHDWKAKKKFLGLIIDHESSSASAIRRGLIFALAEQRDCAGEALRRAVGIVGKRMIWIRFWV